MKYKVGDKVRVRKDLRADLCKVYYMEDKKFGDTFVSGMAHLVGKVVTIKVADKKYTIEECGYNWTDEMFEPVTVQKIVITTDGVETLARLYDGNKVIKSATAKCSPDDTFDFNTGAKLAFDRLIGEEKKEQWRVVNRPVRKGDYIRLVDTSFSFNVIGDILRVSNVYVFGSVDVLGKDHPRDTKQPNTMWRYFSAEFEVVEPCGTPEKPETPKYYNGKVVCVSLGAAGFTKGKVYEFINGRVIDDDGEERPMREDPITCLEDRWCEKFIPFVE